MDERLAAGQAAAVMQQGHTQIGDVDLAVGVEVEARIVGTTRRAAAECVDHVDEIATIDNAAG